MTDNNYASKLDFLFMEWQQRMRANGEVYYDKKGELAFTKDGIVYKNGEENEQTEQNWTNSSNRVYYHMPVIKRTAFDNDENYFDKILECLNVYYQFLKGLAAKVIMDATQ